MSERETISQSELRDMFNEMLDDCYDKFKVGNLEYSASDAFESVDPTAYRVSFLEYIDALIEDGQLIEEGDVYYVS